MFRCWKFDLLKQLWRSRRPFWNNGCSLFLHLYLSKTSKGWIFNLFWRIRSSKGMLRNKRILVDNSSRRYIHLNQPNTRDYVYHVLFWAIYVAEKYAKSWLLRQENISLNLCNYHLHRPLEFIFFRISKNGTHSELSMATWHNQGPLGFCWIPKHCFSLSFSIPSPWGLYLFPFTELSSRYPVQRARSPRFCPPEVPRSCSTLSSKSARNAVQTARRKKGERKHFRVSFPAFRSFFSSAVSCVREWKTASFVSKQNRLFLSFNWLKANWQDNIEDSNNPR